MIIIDDMHFAFLLKYGWKVYLRLAGPKESWNRDHLSWISAYEYDYHFLGNALRWTFLLPSVFLLHSRAATIFVLCIAPSANTHFPHWSQLSNQNYMKFDSDFLMQAVCFYLSDLSWTILKCITCMRFKCDKSHRYQTTISSIFSGADFILFTDLELHW